MIVRSWRLEAHGLDIARMKPQGKARGVHVWSGCIYRQGRRGMVEYRLDAWGPRSRSCVRRHKELFASLGQKKPALTAIVAVAPVHFTPSYRQIICLRPLPDLQADPERERASLPCACRSAAALLQTSKDGSASASYRASGSHALRDLGCRGAELAIHLTPISTRRSAAAIPPCGKNRPRLAISSAGEPCSATLPSARTTILSAASTVRMRWAMTSTVLPASRRRAPPVPSFSFSTSREAVASSSSTMGASLSSARAMEMRWRSPPESRAPFSPMACRSLLAACAQIPRSWRPGRGAHFLVARPAACRGGCSPSPCRQKAPRPERPSNSRAAAPPGRWRICPRRRP